MITEVKAYSSWRSAPTLLLDNEGKAETDVIQIRNIDGLDPVKASVNVSPRGSVDGESHVGSSVPSRNIVLTLGSNPDWDTWSFGSIRRFLYSYFMPKRATRLVFYSDDMSTVEISGIVESVENNMFSKDPEILVSIICPDPYFVAVDPVVVTGQTIRPDGDITIIDYPGTIETGMKVKVTSLTAPDPTNIGILIGEPMISYFVVEATVDATMYFELSSLDMQKYVQNINIGSGIITNLLPDIVAQEGAPWPLFQPGNNEFAVITDQGEQDWELTFFERFGGL